MQINCCQLLKHASTEMNEVESVLMTAENAPGQLFKAVGDITKHSDISRISQMNCSKSFKQFVQKKNEFCFKISVITLILSFHILEGKCSLPNALSCFFMIVRFIYLSVGVKPTHSCKAVFVCLFPPYKFVTSLRIKKIMKVQNLILWFSALYYGVSICLVTFASAMAVVTLNIHHMGLRGKDVSSLFILTLLSTKILQYWQHSS